jgi:NTP pyrophosphatase (non-canonical NTP hydrolase)
MDITTYMEQARRFDNHQDGRLIDALVHGVAAEVGEVMACLADHNHGTDLLHELGDVKWNLIRLADELDYDPSELLRYGWGPAGGDVAEAYRLPVYALKLSGVMEKWYRTTPTPWAVRTELAHHLHGAWQALAGLGRLYGYSPARVSEANIDKLTRRYAERGLPVKEAS